MRLLVIEDEPKTMAYLARGLEESGFVVDTARNGVDGLHLALTGDYDLVVLDVMLPGLDGWSVVEKLRVTKSMPILFLSARDDLEDRIHGLELGADDVVRKPFSFHELRARVKALGRRRRQSDESSRRFRRSRSRASRRSWRTASRASCASGCAIART